MRGVTKLYSKCYEEASGLFVLLVTSAASHWLPLILFLMSSFKTPSFQSHTNRINELRVPYHVCNHNEPFSMPDILLAIR
jgi:hypothetical protein